MEELEAKLRQLPLAKPSGQLKQRIFAHQRSGIDFVSIFRIKVSLGWAAMLALCACLSGMYISNYLNARSEEPRVVNVQIIEAPSERNFLDFTSDDGPGEFMPGDLTVTVEQEQEI
jgi:hypothetical protein